VESVSLAPAVDATGRLKVADDHNSRLQPAFAACCDGLYRFLLVRVGGRRDVADDLLQQTCFIAAGKSRIPVAANELEPWLFGIARNVLRKHWRREKTRGRAMPLLDADGGRALVEAMESGPLPAAVFDRRETTTRLLAAVTALPASEQRMVFAFYFEGRSHADIADAIGVTPKSVESRLYRIRRRLRDLLMHPTKEGLT
jgi:RNA polymerase sigma-70 factor (ECF subfamily)